MNKLNLLGQIMTDIKNDILGSAILRYIAPQFTLKKTEKENNKKKNDKKDDTYDDNIEEDNDSNDNDID